MTIPKSPPCVGPLPWSRLVDYWVGDLADDDTERLEEHLFACESCAGRLGSLQRLGEAVGGWARRRLREGASPALLERLRADRLAVREYSAEDGGSVHCTAGPDDDVVVLHLRADLSGVQRVDLEFAPSHLAEVERSRDLPVVGGREVVFAERAERLRALPRHDTAVRLLAVDDGGERVIARYTLHHSPYPGPAGSSGGAA